MWYNFKLPSAYYFYFMFYSHSIIICCPIFFLYIFSSLNCVMKSVWPHMKFPLSIIRASVSLEFSLSFLLPLCEPLGASQKHHDIKIISASGGSVCGASHWFCSLKKTRLCFLSSLALSEKSCIYPAQRALAEHNKNPSNCAGAWLCLMCRDVNTQRLRWCASSSDIIHLRRLRGKKSSVSWIMLFVVGGFHFLGARRFLVDKSHLLWPPIFWLRQLPALSPTSSRIWIKIRAWLMCAAIVNFQNLTTHNLIKTDLMAWMFLCVRV